MTSKHEHSEVGLSELMTARQSWPDSRWTLSRTGGAEPLGRQPAKGLVASGLDRAGIELDKLNALLKKGNAAGRSIENARAEAARRSATSPEMMSHTLKSVNDRVQQFAGRNVPAAPSEFVLLDTAGEISATSDITLDSTHLGPGPGFNWAKFFYSVERGGAGYGYPGGGDVSFGFRWKNPPGPGARVTAHASLVLDGLCVVSTNGGFFVLNNFSHLRVYAALFIHELWHDPPTSPLLQATQTQQAVDLSVSTWGFFQAGDIAADHLSRGFDLTYSDLAVPGGAAVMFEVSVGFGFYIHNGATWADFRSQPHQMISPGVLLNVSYLNEP